MQFREKIQSLKERIIDQVGPLIKEDFVYLDLPYHNNIGDTLIWEGTLAFFKHLPHRCTYRSAVPTFKSSNIPAKGGTILLHGGGNFGDLWPDHQRFRMEIIQKYPKHRIIILPQTFYYQDQVLMKQDAEIMATHPDLHICARDHKSLALLKEHFNKNNILLVPDMAFCIPQKTTDKYRVKTEDKTLILKRIDKELPEGDIDKLKPAGKNVEIRDWPTLEQSKPPSRKIYALLNNKYSSRGMVDWYAHHFFKNQLLKVGIAFVSEYNEIYTTRLHVAILAVLLHKPFYFLDNSYGKNSTFFDTWLSDLEGATFVK